jgi:hypothetical protein
MERALFKALQNLLLAREISPPPLLDAKPGNAGISAGVGASDWRRNLDNFSVSSLA